MCEEQVYTDIALAWSVHKVIFLHREGGGGRGKNHTHINNALFWVVAEHKVRGEKSERDILETFQFVLILALASHNMEIIFTRSQRRRGFSRSYDTFKQKAIWVTVRWIMSKRCGRYRQRQTPAVSHLEGVQSFSFWINTPPEPVGVVAEECDSSPLTVTPQTLL